MSWIKKGISFAVMSLFIIMSLPVAYQVMKYYRSLQHHEDGRVRLPNSEQYADAASFFQEQQKLLYKPRSFVMYEPLPFSGDWINIEKINDELVRRSINQSQNSDYWFFGGSTMFGDSSPDEDTIPSQYASLTGHTVLNFGVGAYNSRHNLSRLLNALNSPLGAPKSVIFYDGVNNVVAGCYTTLEYLPQQYKEDDMLKKYHMSGNKVSGAGVGFITVPYRKLFQKLKQVVNGSLDVSPQAIFNDFCHDSGGEVNKERLTRIAKSQCFDWWTASELLQSLGIKFVGALQPHLWSNVKHRVSHLKEEERMGQKRLYITYYQIFNNECGKLLGDNYFDLSTSLDGEDYYFVDSVHLSPKGNELMAASFNNILK